MAKPTSSKPDQPAPAEQPSMEQSIDVLGLAERLFVQHWTPSGSYQVSHMVDQCFEAAEAFAEHAKSRQNAVAAAQ